MPPPRSTTYQRLRALITERMRMSPIDQPLMLLELPSRRSPAPAQPGPGAGRGPADPGKRGAERCRISGIGRSQRTNRDQILITNRSEAAA
jgi:hypothetical protein